jgi:hypothetical protein
MPSSNYPQPPAEIYTTIIELAAIDSDRRTYHRHHLDTDTLLSLCLVSKFIYALATPILYSFIELSSHEAIVKLERLSRTNPRLLHHTRTLLFVCGHLRIATGWLAQTIAQGAVGLERLCIAGSFPHARAFCRLDGPNHDGLREFIALHSSPSANDPLFSFPFRGLRKLTLDTIDFRNSKMVTALLGLRNLTHLAVVSFDVNSILGINTVGASGMIQDAVIDSPDLFVWNLRKYMEEALSEPRVILGIVLTLSETANRHEALVRKFDSLAPRLLFVPYWPGNQGLDWFRDQILDGTLWDRISN